MAEALAQGALGTLLASLQAQIDGFTSPDHAAAVLTPLVSPAINEVPEVQELCVALAHDKEHLIALRNQIIKMAADVLRAMMKDAMMGDSVDDDKLLCLTKVVLDAAPELKGEFEQGGWQQDHYGDEPNFATLQASLLQYQYDHKPAAVPPSPPPPAPPQEPENVPDGDVAVQRIVGLHYATALQQSCKKFVSPDGNQLLDYTMAAETVGPLVPALLSARPGLQQEFLRNLDWTGSHFECVPPPLVRLLQVLEQDLTSDLDLLECSNPSNNQALLLAAYYGNVTKVAQLLQEGNTDVNYRVFEVSALMLAATRNHHDVVAELCSHSANSALCDKNGRNALMMAAKAAAQDLQSVKKLLSGFPDTFHRGLDGKTALALAAEDGKREIVILLKDNIPSDEKIIEDLNLAFMLAASHGHVAILEPLAADLRVACATYRKKANSFAIVRAAANGHLTALQTLLDDVCRKACCHIDACDEHCPALHYAAKHGHLDVVKFLLVDCSASPNKRSKSDETALMVVCACTEPRADIATTLLDLRADVTCRMLPESVTALCIACENGNLELYQILRERHALLNDTDKNGVSLLMYAARAGKLEMVQRLIGDGINLHALDNQGRGVVTYAAEVNATEILRVLVAAGADHVAGDQSGKTPIMVAAERGMRSAIEFLAQYYTDANLVDKIHGRTALLWAAVSNQPLAVECLLNLKRSGGGWANLDVDAQDNTGKTSLVWAAEKGYATVAKNLLLCDANAGATDSDACTPLILAVKCAKAHEYPTARGEVVQVLLSPTGEHGQNVTMVNSQDKDGWTALHWAARLDDPDACWLLLDAGANANARTKDDRTSLQIAVSRGAKGRAVACMLVERGAQFDETLATQHPWLWPQVWSNCREWQKPPVLDTGVFSIREEMLTPTRLEAVLQQLRQQTCVFHTVTIHHLGLVAPDETAGQESRVTSQLMDLLRLLLTEHVEVFEIVCQHPFALQTSVLATIFEMVLFRCRKPRRFILEVAGPVRQAAEDMATRLAYAPADVCQRFTNLQTFHLRGTDDVDYADVSMLESLLEVQKAIPICLFGPAGSGKTHLMMTLCGLSDAPNKDIRTMAGCDMDQVVKCRPLIIAGLGPRTKEMFVVGKVWEVAGQPEYNFLYRFVATMYRVSVVVLRFPSTRLDGTPRKFDEFQTEARNKLRLLMASVNRNQKKGVPPVVVVVNIGASDQQLPELPLYQQALAQLVQTECQPAANETVWVDVSNREQVIKSFFPALVKVWEQTCVLFPRHRTDMRERLAVFKKQAGILNTLVHVDEDFACGEVYPFEASNSPFLNCAQLCLELKLPVDQGLSRSKADWRAVIAQLAETGDIIILPHDSATIEADTLVCVSPQLLFDAMALFLHEHCDVAKVLAAGAEGKYSAVQRRDLAVVHCVKKLNPHLDVSNPLAFGYIRDVWLEMVWPQGPGNTNGAAADLLQMLAQARLCYPMDNTLHRFQVSMLLRPVVLKQNFTNACPELANQESLQTLGVLLTRKMPKLPTDPAMPSHTSFSCRAELQCSLDTADTGLTLDQIKTAVDVIFHQVQTVEEFLGLDAEDIERRLGYLTDGQRDAVTTQLTAVQQDVLSSIIEVGISWWTDEMGVFPPDLLHQVQVHVLQLAVEQRQEPRVLVWRQGVLFPVCLVHRQVPGGVFAHIQQSTTDQRLLVCVLSGTTDDIDGICTRDVVDWAMELVLNGVMERVRLTGGFRGVEWTSTVADGALLRCQIDSMLSGLLPAREESLVSMTIDTQPLCDPKVPQVAYVAPTGQSVFGTDESAEPAEFDDILVYLARLGLSELVTSSSVQLKPMELLNAHRLSYGRADFEHMLEQLQLPKAKASILQSLNVRDGWLLPMFKLCARGLAANEAGVRDMVAMCGLSTELAKFFIETLRWDSPEVVRGALDALRSNLGQVLNGRCLGSEESAALLHEQPPVLHSLLNTLLTLEGITSVAELERRTKLRHEFAKLTEPNITVGVLVYQPGDSITSANCEALEAVMRNESIFTSDTTHVVPLLACRKKDEILRLLHFLGCLFRPHQLIVLLNVHGGFGAERNMLLNDGQDGLKREALFAHLKRVEAEVTILVLDCCKSGLFLQGSRGFAGLVTMAFAGEGERISTSLASKFLVPAFTGDCECPGRCDERTRFRKLAEFNRAVCLDQLVAHISFHFRKLLGNDMALHSFVSSPNLPICKALGHN